MGAELLFHILIERIFCMVFNPCILTASNMFSLSSLGPKNCDKAIAGIPFIAASIVAPTVPEYIVF